MGIHKTAFDLQASVRMDDPNVEYYGHHTPYQYSFCPLQTSTQIRILELFPGRADQGIECALTRRPLRAYRHKDDPVVEYEALSYTWGEDKDMEQIQIFTEGVQRERQYTMKVTKNLWLALRAFRRQKDRRRLWVDALCIDQTSISERNHQVSIMSTIYQESTEVCVWLGEASPEYVQAIRFIKQINIETFDNLAHDGKNSPEWIALHSLMKRPWFNRRWIVQEIALAARAKLYCGEDWVDWERFKIAVSLFNSAESRDQAISRTLNTMAISGYRPDYLGDINSLAATRLVQLTSNIYRRSGPTDAMKTGRKLLTLEALISNLTAFEARDPKDTFYAILNLAKDVIAAKKNKDDEAGDVPQVTRDLVAKAVGRFTQQVNQKVFHIDYEKSVFGICKDFLNHVFELDQSLDIICRPWVPEEAFPDNEESPEKQCPSWLRTTAETAYGLRPDGAFMRAHADTLVGSPVLARRNYNASKPNVNVKWEFPDRGGSYILAVDGFMVDKVKEVHHHAMSGNIPYSWLSAGGWRHKDQEPPEPLWRTLVADRASNGLSPPDHWPLALSTAVNQTVRKSPIDTSQLVGNQSTATSVREFLRRVQEVTWGRALIKTKYNHLGLAHETVQEGDSICILYGCSVPVILRQRPKAINADQNAQYNFIGECYVHDMMEGEAFDLARRRNGGKLPEETFELR